MSDRELGKVKCDSEGQGSQSESNATTQTSDSDQGDFYIVGIGASAGGLEALESMFQSMPEDTAMAFVIVQHLSPDFKSVMDELLARQTSLPIHRVTDGMLVEPNAVYLIPARMDMIISDGRLLLTSKDPSQSLNLPIDHFFRSLAQDAGRHAIAVVLSGTGSDGSRGIRDVHGAGGLVIVQSEATAKFDGMPQSALMTGIVDITEAPENIPELLTRYADNPVRMDWERSGERPADESNMGRILHLLQKRHKIDFHQYKSATIGRRIERRIQLNRQGDLDDYVEMLAEDPEELDRLYQDLLIGVTSFFRDPDAFESLKYNVLLPMLSQFSASEEFRVWVAACGTGEEAYSIAITIDECLNELNRQMNVKIFATDVHKTSLDFAHRGLYASASLDEVSEARRENYFEATDTGYLVSSKLREMIVFAPHDLVKDSPFTRLQLVTCRNILIYLRAIAQKKVVSLFHFGLNTGGVMFMGASETPGDFSDEFDTIDQHSRLYRKRRDVRLAVPMRGALGAQTLGPKETTMSREALSGPGRELLAVYDELLARKMPPALLVNQHREVVHVFGGAGKYFSVIDGRLSGNLFDMVCGDLKLALTGAVQRASTTGQSVSCERIAIELDGGKQQIRLEVAPLRSRGAGEHYLISFEELDSLDFAEVPPPESISLENVARRQIDSLENELRFTKENLQAAVEELETSNEELQATNEELVASNEELQSTNEELHSVNAEFQRKIRELTELSNDIDNLLECTEVHTLFLDKQLCIRRFTPLMAPVFNLLLRDAGRPIEGFTHRLVCENLSEKIEAVVNGGGKFEEEVRDADGADYLMRILPYLVGNRIEGVVLTLVEMSKLKQFQRDLDADRSRYEDSLNAQVSGRDRFLAMLSHELRNPMAAILNTIDAVDKEEGTLEQPMQIIQRQSRHIARLLDDLLDVARIQQNRIEFRKQAVDLIELSEEVLEGLRYQFEAKDQILHVTTCDGPLAVHGDRSRLMQAQINLLMNASKYTPASQDIWYEIDREGDSAVITVRDSGLGIPEELREKIFELFVQSDSTLDRSDGGMGVGLSLAQRIINAHDGMISAESEGMRKGSTFCIRLPVTLEPLKSNASPPAYSFQGRKLLLVEDNDDARTMLCKMLGLSGFEVAEAHDGNSALQQFSAFKPDVAVIDIGLPGMNGYEVARAVREQADSRQVMLIALTGYGRPEDYQAAIDAGFDLHLVKPLNPAELYRAISARFAVHQPS